MDLFKDILAHVLSGHDMIVSFPELQGCLTDIVELKCFQALRKIKAILEDESLEDVDCFFKIEEIICALESLGSNGGLRHHSN